MNRSSGIDLLRGFIMILMAIDHASAMIARVHFGEMWGVDFKSYPDLGWWFTRFVSHLCAPGFFMLMGMSIFLFSNKRKDSNWEDSKIRQYFWKRGSLILLFMLFLEFPAWGLGFSFSQMPASENLMPGHYTEGFFFPTTVLYGLGACMIIGSFLWKLKDWQLILITISSFVLSSWYISNSNPSEAFNPFEHLFLVPGMSWGAMVIYPIIPWLGIMTFGMFWAQLLQKRPQSMINISLITGLIFIALFVVFRFLEFGNFQKNGHHDWISFFTLIKYPPSLVFSLITVGINLLLFSLFSKLGNPKYLKPVLIIGQTAMFFYILHLYVYAVMGIFFPHGASIEIMYLLWGIGLILLYFACKSFLNFKKKKPLDSIWRMI